MGNIFGKIFNYLDYIDNINEKTIIDDIKIQNELRGAKLVEGLMTTHPSEKSLNIIIKRFPNLAGNIELDGEIYLQGDFSEIKNYVSLFNNLGYFISKFTTNGENWEVLIKNDDKPVAIFLEPKYDQEINIISRVLYHTTLFINEKNILKVGIIPKSKNKESAHPERIYLTDDINLANNFGKYLKSKNSNRNYSIFEINTTNLDIKLYRDINLTKNGFYTLDNIPISYIKLHVSNI
jgi:hypothetical protein